jgi:hypothetical protein
MRRGLVRIGGRGLVGGSSDIAYWLFMNGHVRITDLVC